ncbi:MAG: FtsX-like permease family protein [Clostridia bacterium]
MRINEILRLVLINIKQNKFKVFLTSLGIIVGAATIVMVIAIGEGGKQDVTEQYSTLNAGTITIETSSGSGFDLDMMEGMEGMEGMMEGLDSIMGGMDSMMSGMTGGMTSGASSSASVPSASIGSGMSSAGGISSVPGMDSGITTTTTVDMDANALSEEELDNLLYFVSNIEYGALSASTTTDVYGGILEDYTEYTIVGTQESYQDISNLSLLIGDFITESDEENETRCVILGYDVAVAMFDSLTDAYDAKIEIDGRAYVVNGVLAEMGTVVSGINPDSSIFMPYSTADKYLLGDDTTPTISLLSNDINNVDQIMEDVALVLEQDLPDGDFDITDAGATMDAAMESANTLSLLLLAIAVIVFIVGGIGIMNVLFVSVKERTREIGILKAIGTSKVNILMLFVLEASIIGVLGGLLGIGLSLVFIPVLEYLNITIVMTSSSFLLAFLFAVVTGTLFGFYPAYSASNLVPIDALNND